MPGLQESVSSKEIEPSQAFFVSRWLTHVQMLAETIGPRGSTRQGEREGSDYCCQTLVDLGFNPEVEPFSSARSIYHPHLLSAIFMLISFGIYSLGGRTAAQVAFTLSLVVVISEWLELSLRDNLLRRLIPRGFSQNVVATVLPKGEVRRDVVLIGHVDSHRTPIFFRSDRWLQAYRVFVAIAFPLSMVQIVLYGLGAIFQWPWIWPATIPAAVAAIIQALICVQADSTPFSAGANDNATGAGLVLTMAQHLLSEPLVHTRVWLACTGCEEVQHYGAADFFRRHTPKLIDPAAVVFESLGCAGPAWLTREGIVVPFRASQELVVLAQRVAGEHPEYGAYPVQISGGNTEMADALLAGVPAITIGGADPQGGVPYWHQVEDTFDKMDPEVMARAYAFTCAFLRSLDT